MPIPAEEFLEIAVAKTMKFKGSNQREILSFLREHPDEAYTQSEVQLELDIRYAPSVNASLHSLRLRGLVTCKMVNGKNYWRATPWEDKPSPT